MDKQICANCKFWKRASNLSGECRRYAPRPYFEESVLVDAKWSETNADDWCGEFQQHEK